MDTMETPRKNGRKNMKPPSPKPSKTKKITEAGSGNGSAGAPKECAESVSELPVPISAKLPERWTRPELTPEARLARICLDLPEAAFRSPAQLAATLRSIFASIYAAHPELRPKDEESESGKGETIFNHACKSQLKPNKETKL
jgi:hypothetical protein